MFENADAFVETQRGAREPFPDEQVRILSISESGSTVLVEMVAEGTHTAPMMLPTGDTIAPTGKRISVHVCAAADYDSDGMVTACRAYNNPMELMGQLGIMPGLPQQITLDTKAPVASG